jgi:hypothetical protein
MDVHKVPKPRDTTGGHLLQMTIKRPALCSSIITSSVSEKVTFRCRKIPMIPYYNILYPMYFHETSQGYLHVLSPNQNPEYFSGCCFIFHLTLTSRPSRPHLSLGFRTLRSTPAALWSASCLLARSPALGHLLDDQIGVGFRRSIFMGFSGDMGIGIQNI